MDDIRIIFEDDALIILDKPAGLLTHGGPGDMSLVEFLTDVIPFGLPEVRGPGQKGIVHRLDRETSGVHVSAKTEFDQRYLIDKWHRVKKFDLAIVSGIPKMSSHEIIRPIATHPIDATKSIIADNGKYSVTRWRVLETFGTAYSLFKCEIDTGRTHQTYVPLVVIPISR